MKKWLVVAAFGALAVAGVLPGVAMAIHAGNDFRSGAIVLPARAAPYEGHETLNHGAGVDGEPDILCEKDNVGLRSTIWFRFVADARGTVTFRVSGNRTTTPPLDPVIQVYRGNEPAPVDCSDDEVPGTLTASVSRYVFPGEDYYVQLGSAPYLPDPGNDPGCPPSPNLCWPTGLFLYAVSFSADLDIDRDGSPRPADCDDNNATVYPGAPEVLNNDVDENCNGLRGYDRDHDGSPVGDPNQDCDDGNAGIHPGAREIAGNGVDENCDGDVRRSSVFGTIKQNLRWFKKYSKVVRITARGLVPGSRVTLRCKRRRCKLRRKSKTITRGTSLKVEKFFRNRKVRVKTVIEIAILPPNGEYRGKWRSLKIRSNRAPKETNRCIVAGSRRPVRC